MPYTINRTNGTKIVTVQDGTINTTALDITLVGKNYTGYGEVINENLVKILENFASSSKPSTPLTGQLWYDSVNRTVKLFTGLGTGDAQWKSVGVIERGNTKPSGNSNAGDLWYNTSDNRLYAYPGSGSVWTLIGPLTTRGSANGVLDIEVQVKDTTVKNLVLRVVSNDGNVAFCSNESFDVNTSEADIQPTFNAIKQGITLPGADANGRSISVDNDGNVSGYQIWGSAATARALVRKNNVYVSADDFLRTTELASLSNNINIGNDEGVLIGTQGVMKLHVTDGNTGNITIISQGANPPSLKVNIGNTSSNVLTINTTTNANEFLILPGSGKTVWLGTASQRVNFAFIGTITSTSISGTSISGSTVSGTTVNDNGNRVITSVGVTAGTGLSGGGTITGPSGTISLTNTGVLSLTGTSNRISVSAASGNVTLNLPQDINATANVTFNSLTAATISGTEVYDNGNRVLTSSSVGGSAVKSLTGTANQVNVSGSVGDITLSLPQSIHTSATPTFSSVTVTTANVSTLAASGGSGTVTGAWTLGSGATFQASYADLAERYAADNEYEAGTVLVIGGTEEVTTTGRHGDTARAGIVSTEPAYKLNHEAGTDATHPYIALAGRVPCKVKGFVRKGDLLVTSTEAGYAEAAHPNDHPNAILARALEDFDGTFGVIQVMVV